MASIDHSDRIRKGEEKFKVGDVIFYCHTHRFHALFHTFITNVNE